MSDVVDFIRSCIFMHDDFTLGDTDCSDWDLSGTKPFILGSDYCVSREIESFGVNYIEYLKMLGCYPKNILTPKSQRNNSSLIDCVLEDQVLLSNLRDIIAEKKLDLSTYYSGTKELRLQQELKSNGRTPELHPSHDIFRLANDKIAIRLLLSKSNIPQPVGEICTSKEEVRMFFQHYATANGIVLKKDHWDVRVIRSLEQLSLLKMDFPVLVERFYPSISSPVTHNLVWKGIYSHLFTVQQVLNNDFLHSGNYSPTKLEDRIKSILVDISKEVMRSMNRYTGICGIDFIITDDAQVFVVDINPRFNSSTYPYYFLHQMGLESERVFSRYGFTACSLTNLDDVFRDKTIPLFSKRDGEGVLFFSPVREISTNKITQVAYLCIAKSAPEVNQQEEMIRKSIRKIN